MGCRRAFDNILHLAGRVKHTLGYFRGEGLTFESWNKAENKVTSDLSARLPIHDEAKIWMLIDSESSTCL